MWCVCCRPACFPDGPHFCEVHHQHLQVQRLRGRKHKTEISDKVGPGADEPKDLMAATCWIPPLVFNAKLATKAPVVSTSTAKPKTRGDALAPTHQWRVFLVHSPFIAIRTPDRC